MYTTMPVYADSHADVFFQVAVQGANLFTGENTHHMTYDTMREVNQRLQVCSLWTPPTYAGEEAEAFAFNLLDHLDRNVRERPDAFVKIRHAHQLRRVLDEPEGPIGLIPWIEGASPVRGSLEVFNRFVDRGVKGIGLVWNHANEVADGCGCEMPRRGLTEFGRELLDAMHQRRVIIDGAHLPEPAFWDVIEHMKRPMVISHVGMRALVPLTRNISDAMARAVAESGGLVGIDFYHGHIYEHSGKPCARQATLDDMMEHIKRAVNVCGENNVVLGGDFDGFGDPIAGLTHVRDLPNVVDAMRRAGFTERQVEKITGLNLIERLIQLW